MNFTHPAHQEMIIHLLDHKVDFILIGGYAVIYHGYVRATGDMDLWLRPTNENKTKLLMAFQTMDFDPEGMKFIEALDFTDVVVFHIGVSPERIDFLSKVQGLKFDEAYNRKQVLSVKGLEVPVLHLDDLIVTKILANRLQDQADLEKLQLINQLKKHKK